MSYGRSTISLDTITTAPHDPDCSAITDDELRKNIIAHWPVKDGKTEIIYDIKQATNTDYSYGMVMLRFSVMPVLRPILSLIYSGTFERETYQSIKALISPHLELWSKASNNTIRFIENPEPKLFSSGLHFLITDRDLLASSGFGGLEMSSINNNGLIYDASVFIPGNSWAPYHEAAISHEIGHALGFDHLHQDQNIKSKLEKIPDGVFCSVMPYYQLIVNSVNNCYHDCYSMHAAMPSQLDKRMLSLVTKEGLPADVSGGEYLLVRSLSYALQAYEVMFFTKILTSSHQNIDEFISKVKFQNKLLLSKNSASMIADASIAAFIIALEYPLWIPGLFMTVAMTRYLPDRLLNLLPVKFKSVFQNNYHLYILNLSIAYLKGQDLIPWLLTSALSVAGSFEQLNNSSLDQIQLEVDEKEVQVVKQKPVELSRIKVDKVQPSTAVANSQNQHAFYHRKSPPKRESICIRIMNAICYKK
jgi:hypothetical protein